MPPRRFRTWVRRITLGLLAATSLAIAWIFLIWDNFGTVRPSDLHRSSQMSASSLAQTIRDYRIKTVLNLRGSHLESPWYVDERAATIDGGATQVDIPLSSCEWMSRAQARALLEILETAERPILVHCYHGSERTGMVSAFAELLRPGSTLIDAEAQFTVRHLYFNLGDGVVTRQHLELYEKWLKERSLTHSSQDFRRWLGVEYQPGEPSRERWNYDPYPLVVITKGIKRGVVHR